MREYDAMGQGPFLRKYGFGPSRDFIVVVDGSEYDSKAIVGAAHGFEHPELGPLEAKDFSGGRPTVGKLEALGFKIEQVGEVGREDGRPVAWMVRGGKEGQSEQESLANDFVAIGWGDLSDLANRSSEEIGEQLKEARPDKSKFSIANQKAQVYSFGQKMAPGDLALLPLKTNPGHIAVGRVVGPYAYRATAPWDVRHIRPVKWLSKDVPIEKFERYRRWLDLPKTIVPITDAEAVGAILKMLETGQTIASPAEKASELPAILEGILEELQADEPTPDGLRSLVTRDGPDAITELLSKEWTANGRTGMGTRAEVPWIGVYPSDSDASARTGFYAVFLFAADGSTVYLSLNQATERLRGGTKPLEKRVLDLRSAADIPPNTNTEIDLASTASRPKKYEAGSAYAVRYGAGEVPVVEQLQRDLNLVLEYVTTARDRGLEFDPVLEPVDLVFKWSADFEAQTVELHRAVADERGSVWWGRFGGGTALSASRLEQLEDQLKDSIPTHVYLYGGAETVRAELREITADPETVDEERLPGYYSKDQCNLFVRISDFETLDESWLRKHLVLANNPDPSKLPGALGNQTNPLYVFELFSPGEGSNGGAPEEELTIEWLRDRTLWQPSQLEELLEAIDQRGQVILAGPPGTGKTWVAEHVARFLTQDEPLRRRTVQFHPSYGYEEFVEGIRPTIDRHGVLHFDRVDGVIKQMASEMEGSSAVRVLLVDELNRANIPRVFGELMYLLEYRESDIDLQYSRGFQLPKNLKIIATMNTADRSIRSIDVALRRRFEIFECPADASVLSRYYEATDRSSDVPSLVEGFQALNAELTSKIDRHHTIGQSFFMRDTYSSTELSRVWARQIKPLIEDYFFDQEDLVESFTLERFWPNS